MSRKMFAAGAWPQTTSAGGHVAPSSSYLRKKGRGGKGKEDRRGEEKKGNGRERDYHPNWRYVVGSPALLQSIMSMDK